MDKGIKSPRKDFIKSTGMIRSIDDLGRVCIPREIRRSQRLHDNEKMEILVQDGMICLKPFRDEITIKNMISDLMKVIDLREKNLEMKKYVSFKLKEALDIIGHYEKKEAKEFGEPNSISHGKKMIEGENGNVADKN